MEPSAEHRKHVIKGSTGGLLGWLACCKLATAQNKTLHAVVDILTIIMASSLLALHCKVLMDPTISTAQSALMAPVSK